MAMEKAVFSNNSRIWIEAPDICRRRIIEFERFKAYLTQNGFSYSDSIDDADIVAFYHCAFNADSEKAAILHIKNITKKVPSIVLLSGIANIRPEVELKQYVGDCSLHCVAFQDEDKIDSLFCHGVPLSGMPMGNDSWKDPEKYIIQIGFGCESHCSYCGDRDIVGPLKSLPLDDIVRQFESGLSNGHRNFNLVGDDAGAWGQDCGSNIIELLDIITSHGGDYTVSLEEVNIKYLIRYIDRIESILERNRIKFLVVAFQHINDRILGLMDRGYTGEDVKRLSDILTKHGVRKRFHALICFPSETREELLQNARFACGNNFYSGSFFVYQERDYSPAAKLPGHFSFSEKKDAVDAVWEYCETHGYTVDEKSYDFDTKGYSGLPSVIRVVRTDG
jgi:ribosomal protein S12 methylthiotransferase